MKNIKQSLGYVLFPLFIGFIIYIISRIDKIYFLKFLELNITKVNLPYWIKYNLPDGLWSFSLTVLVLMIWDWRLTKNAYFWILIILFVSLILEIYFGTFDIFDVLFLIIGILSPFLFFRKKIIYK
ncbi:hypothetical protein [Elizabethkingia bruuniana]|uniref:hypothetical protein n=1 Tax=Elizabethkingia bruuniana TaxID=1756149 RepID=UPI0009990AB3|nr:hypothetical protein [Elizabethkingia bruuniana]OPC54799.1 hypothetical protein BAY07_18045 [Elizabethkingia bruuniana]OPC66630.1 hypothetical protein BAY13_18095 [Elizabethkingia bruuniana]